MKAELKRRVEILEAQFASSQMAPRVKVLRFLKPTQNTEEIPAFEQKRMRYQDYKLVAGGNLVLCGEGIIRWPTKARNNDE